MTAETASPRGSAFTRARLAFRRWRRTRPFWGGLFLLLSGLEIFYSGNLDLGNIQIHMGLPGFQSYIIPLILVLCGALVWFTPDQRIFYGVIGVLAAVYSLIGANLGGFIVGFFIGTIGGGLAASWVPQKHHVKSVASDDDSTAELDSDIQESQGLDVIDSDDDNTPVAGVGGGAPLHDTLPTSAQSPLVPQNSRHAVPDDAADGDAADGDTGSAADESLEGKQGARFPRPRDAANGSDVTGETERSATTFRWSPRTALAVIAAVSVATIGIVTLQSPTAASAETCASPALINLLDKAQTKKTATMPRGGTRQKTSTSTRNQTAKTKDGFAGFASVPSDSGPLDPLVGTVTELLTGDATASSSPDPSPSAEPTTTPDPTPSTAPTTSTPKPSPSSDPTTTPTPKPTSSPTAKPEPSGSAASPSPSPSKICTVTKFLAGSGSQPNVNEKPSKMTTALLTMSGLSFDGVVDLPTKSGSMKALQFSMDSSTSTPFELQPVSSNGNIDINSSKLTVSSNVKFYCTEIKGNLLGALPVDYTVDSPPPLVLSDLYFTDVTIQLAFVYADSLTAANLDIKVS